MKGRPKTSLAKSFEPRFPQPGLTPAGDTAAVMKFYKFPKAFPKAALDEAERVAAQPVTPEGRLDLRRKFIFTCDPESARDYDDALSLEKDRKGRRVLGVHIADVSHYVREGGALDREAERRSTSVYLCDRVIPMLPELLSNGVCSLVPGEDRYAFSAFLTFSDDGECVGAKFAKTILKSRMRYTYAEVMSMIEGGAGRGGKSAAATVRAIAALAGQIRRRRFAAGALDIEVPETEPVLNDEGELTGLAVRTSDESHQMIEECMVAANEAVAKELWANGVKILTRLHEPPDAERLQCLRQELRGFGLKIGDLANPKIFGAYLAAIRENPLYPVLSMLTLRSMKRAVYDSREIGHFGLAKKYYAHFTSPIRRYPDLTLHRQLSAWLVNKARARVDPKTLAKWAERATAREQTAAEAERGLMEIKKFRVLEAELATGHPPAHEAMIVRCMPFGCFVEIPELAVSGLVHISLLSDRFVRYNEYDQTLSLPGGRGWRVGDRLKVRVAAVDFRQRRVELIPC